jgi:3-methyladenine DNA glycosylase/8-oxoguanine DNA glycosylase
MELTQKMRSEMNFAELDKTYIPGQEKLPVVAYQLIKSLISFIVGQHNSIKKLETKVRELKKKG